jgi:hypothetical protein
MRVLLKVSPHGEGANKAIHDGTWGRLVGEFMQNHRPEAAYFGAENGQRVAWLFFDLKSESDMVRVAEPFFTKTQATVEITPVMNGEDVQKGLAALGA